MESALRQRACEHNIQLIETLGWDGHRFGHLEAHMLRMSSGAMRLGFTFDPSVATDLLLSKTHESPARLRLTLDRAGTMTVQSTPLLSAKTLWHISLAMPRLQSNDPWLSLKSTHRPAYDAARAALAEGIDEVILQNERGEACDGSITTLFFDRGQGLRTPPLHCGVLPGVLRAQMACPEEIVTVQELKYLRLWVGNSLRGLIRANWVEPNTPCPVA